MKVNNNLGGGQVTYLGEKEINDSIQTYNVSADNVQVDKLVETVYNEWNGSKQRELMLQGIEYFKNDTQIDKKKRFDYLGSHGKENTKLYNAKQKKNIMRKLTKQKATYFMGKPFSIETDDDGYTEILEKDYFNKYFHRTALSLVQESIKEGINWLNPYYDEAGKLQFRLIPGNEVKPFWADREHTKLSQLIHYFDVQVYEGDKSKTVTYADYYYSKGVIHYIKEDKGFVRDMERPLEEANFSVMVEQQEEHVIGIDEATQKEIIETRVAVDENGNPIMVPQQMVWNILPWVPLKYNSDELSLLKFIKEAQDNYEALFSTAIDVLKDIPEAIKIIKGYNGSNLEELMNDIMQFRAMIVDTDGDVANLETKANVESFKTLLEMIRKDAYEDGAGVDTQTNETGDKSGVALKFLYTDLDNDCNELQKEFDVFIETLLKFIDYDIYMKYGKDYYDQEVNVSYNKSMIINEEEVIESISKSGGVTLPQDILLAKHPLVDNVQHAKELLAKEEEENALKLQEEANLYSNIPLVNNSANNGNTSVEN